MKIKIIFNSLIILSVLSIVVGSNSLAAYATTDNEPDWTTYENSEYGISMDYPDYYNVMEDVSKNPLHDVVFISSGLENQHLGIFTLSVYPNTMTLQEFVDNDIMNEDVVGNNILVEEISPITVSDDISGLSYGVVNNSVDTVLHRNVVFNTDDYIFNFSHTHSKEDFPDDIYEHIIESITVADG